MTDFSHVTDYIRSLYPEMNPVLLHCPQFLGNEKKYLSECIDTKFVSYVSHFVTDMEEHIKKRTGAKYAVAMVNGTEALHMAFVSIGMSTGGGVSFFSWLRYNYAVGDICCDCLCHSPCGCKSSIHRH